MKNNKKIKIEKRLENAVGAFFADDEMFDENRLSFVGETSLSKHEAKAHFEEKADVFVKILKRAFVFFPGVLYLFFGTFNILMFDFLWNPFSVLVVFLIGSFMTIFGIGNLKNPKHLVIPLSIVAVALTAFSVFAVLGDPRYAYHYGIYFFPLALIAPLLAKSLVNDSRRETD